MKQSILFNHSPLIINVQLAGVIGLNEAIFFQQLHYWMQKSTFNHEGRRYIYNSLSDWTEQFPFWSESTIKRITSSLIDKNLIIVEKLSDNKYDRTNYYSINYDCELLFCETSYQTDTNDEVKLTPSSGSKRTNVHPETTTETTTENIYISDQGKEQSPAKQKTSQKVTKDLDFTSWPSLPSEQIMTDWLAHRKSKKATVSQTVINNFGKQLHIAVNQGLTVDECLSECITRNWTGLKAEWLNKSGTTKKQAIRQTGFNCAGLNNGGKTEL